jgi:hypothetical protein
MLGVVELTADHLVLQRRYGTVPAKLGEAKLTTDHLVLLKELLLPGLRISPDQLYLVLCLNSNKLGSPHVPKKIHYKIALLFEGSVPVPVPWPNK